MRSMWDTLDETFVPVNKLAAMVVAQGPVWMRGNPDKPQDPPQAPERRPITYPDVVDVTRPPTGNLKDWRGLRSRRHVVIGFSHVTMQIKKKKPAPSEKRWYQKNWHQVPARHPPKPMPQKTTWFVLRDTGEITLLSTRGGLPSKLIAEDRRLDENEPAPPTRAPEQRSEP